MRCLRVWLITAALLIASTPAHAAFTYVQVAQGSVAAPTATTIATPAITVTAGSLLAAWVKHEGAVTTISVSDGTSTFTAATKTSHANGDTHGQWHYLLVSNGGSKTITATLGAGRDFRSIIVFEYTYSGTASLDGEAGTSGTSTGVISSGNLTTTATDGVAFGGYAEYSTEVVHAARVNAVAADALVLITGGDNFSAAWRKTFTSGFTGAVDITIDSSQAWIVRGIAFKAVGGAGTPTPKLMLLGVGDAEAR
jgi:hypothetical protein